MPVTMLPLLPVAEGGANAAISRTSGTIGRNGSIVTGIARVSDEVNQGIVITGISWRF